MRRLAGLVVGIGVLAAVGCKSNPCQPSLWDKFFGRQPAMVMGEPCPCPCSSPCAKVMDMGGEMDMAYGSGPIFSAPPGAMAGGAPPPQLRGDTTSQPKPLPDQKGYARPMPYVPEKDGK